jgi:F0F1-type ATP synthase gamma subunit
MQSRKDRLRKLVKVQEQLRSLHETRHAVHLAREAAAKAEASELAERFDAPDALSALFPEVYHRRIGKALADSEASGELARAEAEKVATARARTNMVERAYKSERQWSDRRVADRERLDLIDRRKDGK